MRSAYVLSQKDLEGGTDPVDSVGLASYGVDDWPYATLAVDGKVAVNGGEFSMLRLLDKHGGAYTIPYRAIARYRRMHQPAGPDLLFGESRRHDLDPHGAGVDDSRRIGRRCGSYGLAQRRPVQRSIIANCVPNS